MNINNKKYRKGEREIEIEVRIYSNSKMSVHFHRGESIV